MVLHEYYIHEYIVLPNRPLYLQSITCIHYCTISRKTVQLFFFSYPLRCSCNNTYLFYLKSLSIVYSLIVIHLHKSFNIKVWNKANLPLVIKTVQYVFCPPHFIHQKPNSSMGFLRLRIRNNSSKCTDVVLIIP